MHFKAMIAETMSNLLYTTPTLAHDPHIMGCNDKIHQLAPACLPLGRSYIMKYHTRVRQTCFLSTPNIGSYPFDIKSCICTWKALI